MNAVVTNKGSTIGLNWTTSWILNQVKVVVVRSALIHHVWTNWNADSRRRRRVCRQQAEVTASVVCATGIKHESQQTCVSAKRETRVSVPRREVRVSLQECECLASVIAKVRDPRFSSETRDSHSRAESARTWPSRFNSLKCETHVQKQNMLKRDLRVSMQRHKVRVQVAKNNAKLGSLHPYGFETSSSDTPATDMRATW